MINWPFYSLEAIMNSPFSSHQEPHVAVALKASSLGEELMAQRHHARCPIKERSGEGNLLIWSVMLWNGLWQCFNYLLGIYYIRCNYMERLVYNMTIIWLSGWWFGTCVISWYVWNVIIPTDELIHASESSEPPTSNQLLTLLSNLLLQLIVYL